MSGRGVLMVAPRLDAQGGIAVYVRTLVESALARRYDVSVVETVGAGGRTSRLGQTASSLWRADRAMRRLPSGSIVHLHMAQKGSFWRKAAIAALARRRGHRTVMHVHGSRFHLFAQGGSALRRRAVREALERADRVIVLSETWRGRIAEFAPKAQTVIVENAVSIPDVERVGAYESGVLFLGRLGERKGVPTLLDALERLQREGRRVAVTLAGDGEVDQTRTRVAGLPYPEDVRVPGWVDAARVSGELLPTHGTFCLPSRDEGQPIALLEAMARGMACVVTPVGGIPDTVTSGVDAVVVPVDDALALATALGDLLEDPERRVALGSAARETAVRHFSLETAIDALSALYAELGLESLTGGTDE